eukprot:TRINITY_DN23079_c0_g1_i1.p1 TRINITY_DN23079_c0_g1~~TRINITY_DN23079_c0_g1_i1.p1  ORF type:complete len:692 (+),score=219.37 TRINITY_DN23079_c0_g1_i1:92-2167(+)
MLRLDVVCLRAGEPHTGAQQDALGRLVVPCADSAPVSELVRQVATRCRALLPPAHGGGGSPQVRLCTPTGAMLWEDDLVADVVHPGGAPPHVTALVSAAADPSRNGSSCHLSGGGGNNAAEAEAEASRLRGALLAAEAEVAALRSAAASSQAASQREHAERVEQLQRGALADTEHGCRERLLGLHGAEHDAVRRGAQLQAQLAEAEQQLRHQHDLAEQAVQGDAQPLLRDAYRARDKALSDCAAWRRRCKELQQLLGESQVDELRRKAEELEAAAAASEEARAVLQEQCERLNLMVSRAASAAAAQVCRECGGALSSSITLDSSPPHRAPKESPSSRGSQSEAAAQLREAQLKLQAQAQAVAEAEQRRRAAEQERDFARSAATVAASAAEAVQAGLVAEQRAGTRAAMRAAVEAMVAEAVLSSTQCTLNAEMHRQRMLEADHRRAVHDADDLRAAVQRAEEKVEELRSQHRIEIKKKDALIRNLRESLLSQQQLPEHAKMQSPSITSASTPPVAPSAASHCASPRRNDMPEGAVVPPEAPSAATAVHQLRFEQRELMQELADRRLEVSRLQAMVREQADAYADLHESHERKAEVLAEWISSGRAAAELAAVAEAAGGGAGKKSRKDKEDRKQAAKESKAAPQAQAALEEALLANLRLRGDLGRLGGEIAALQAGLEKERREVERLKGGGQK